MNALYRPGPMEYIPNYIARKHGREKIQYDLPEMEEYLSETYGITVYQEQVMLLSQRISDFTKGEADQLRKAMGKKDSKLLELLKPKFFDGGKKNKIEEIGAISDGFKTTVHPTATAGITFIGDLIHRPIPRSN